MKKLLLILLLPIANIKAVVLFGTGDPSANISAPTKPELINSGWQYMGFWGNFTGVPVSSNYFLAATHVGGSVGDVFTFQGKSYTTVAKIPDPTQVDITLWKVTNSFPIWAPLYNNYSSSNRAAVLIGRGTQRGGEVWWPCGVTAHQIAIPSNLRVTNTQSSAYSPVYSYTTIRVTNQVMLGWQWGASDNVMRWGTNVALVNTPNSVFFMFTGKGADEGTVSVGDSSGGVFLLDDDGIWKLAGSMHSVGGDVLMTPTNAIYGAYYQLQGCSSVGNSTSIATAIAPRVNWIFNVVSQP